VLLLFTKLIAVRFLFEAEMDEERSDELRTLELGTKAERARTSVQEKAP